MSRRRPIAFLLCLGPWLPAGCSVDGNSPNPLHLRNLDFNDFACKVQPLLAARCSMNACHGQEEHALRVYSPGKLRLVPQSTLAGRDGPITMDELHANMASASGVAPLNQHADETPLVHKPLAPTAGGGEHKGGVIFHDKMDPGYIVLHNWLAGETLPGGCDLLTQLQMPQQ